jgi:hypothetical protein
MSDSFEMLVDVDVSEGDAQELSAKVIEALVDRGLIVATANEDCVLGGMGYFIGPKIKRAYKLSQGEGAFWKLTTSGVEPVVQRGFNEWALGPVCEGLICPSCRAKFMPFDEKLGDTFGDPFAKSIGNWMKGIDAASACLCPRCSATIPLTEWGCDPPLGFGNLAFRFWNWPPLRSSGWRIDICELVQRETGHRVVHTHGHI